MAETICDLMIKDHMKINKMLLDFDKAPRNKPETSLLFEEFKWNLEKHFFTEEKAIFAIMQNIDGADIEGIFHLREEHEQLMNLMKKEEQSIKIGSHSDISPLLELLKKHAEFEDEEFYPKLDDFLKEDQKKEIIKRIKSIVIY
jgi:hypothetical protein